MAAADGDSRRYSCIRSVGGQTVSRDALVCYGVAEGGEACKGSVAKKQQ
jgi:hypothetical protein